MYHISFKSFLIKGFTLFLLSICFVFVWSIDSHAISIADYSYTKVYNALPEKYQSDTYIYKSSDDVCLIAFATYNGNDYRTSVKKKSGTDELLYCIDHNDQIEFRDQYELRFDFFNMELKTRLAMLYYYNPSTWGAKSNSEFTTGNFVLDYYMTQIVTHALIYKYGDNKSSMGINIDKLVFKDDTTKLKNKTLALYKFCCDATIKYPNGLFQRADFMFNKAIDKNLYLQDGNFVSSSVSCVTHGDNANVTEFTHTFKVDKALEAYATLLKSDETYAANLQVSIPGNIIEQLTPNVYNISVNERVVFDMKEAGLWQCSAADYMGTTQELGGLISTPQLEVDGITFDLLVGKLYLYKTDSITTEDIMDAQFQILQYNSNTGAYEYFGDMVYNATDKRYESSNLYLTSTNTSGRFKVIETTPGVNYVLDWAGQEFEVTKDTYIYEIHVENQPVLGKLNIQKKGEQWSYEDKQFIKNSFVGLPNVKFELYAKEDIYVKNAVMYPKEQKIADIYTNMNGEAVVNNLPVGDYYIKETETFNGYALDSNITEFSITRDENRKYSESTFSLMNKLKTCQINLIKCYFNEDDVEQANPIPIEGALFGLYLKDDYCDVKGNILIKKDTCVAQASSNEKGNITFEPLPYAEYYVKELKTPDNFVLNDGIVTIPVNEFQYDETKDRYICDKMIINKLQQFQLEIEKSADSFIDYKEETSMNGTFYSYQVGKQFLENVTFSLYNDKNKIVATETTGADGKAFFEKLIPGKYYIVESQAPSIYQLTENKKELILGMTSKEYNEFAPPLIQESVYNELCECSIQLAKYGEKACVKNNELQYENIPLCNVVYGIYQNFDYSFCDGNKVLPKDSCVGYIVTNEEGIGRYSGKLPCGNYYMKELRTLPGYELDSNLYNFHITSNNNKTIHVSLNDNSNTFYNQLSKAAVQIIKTDANTGKYLKNVEFTLYNEEKEEIGVYKTNRKGKILVENLPYGKYYFVETKAKNGYYSTNNKYYFELQSQETVTLNITNSPILKLGYEENYKKVLLFTAFVMGAFLILMYVSYYNRKRNVQGDE